MKIAFGANCNGGDGRRWRSGRNEDSGGELGGNMILICRRMGARPRFVPIQGIPAHTRKDFSLNDCGGWNPFPPDQALGRLGQSFLFKIGMSHLESLICISFGTFGTEGTIKNISLAMRFDAACSP